jgi:3-phosphoshikimate 1-carboxyvinyltransferase
VGLRQLGVDIDATQLPLTVRGTGAVLRRDASIDASASSQFISGLLLSGARFDQGLRLRHVGATLPSLPHIEMTVQMLRDRGVVVQSQTADPTDYVWDVAPGQIRGGVLQVQPDLSNAGPFLAAAMVTGGRVTIDSWPDSTTQAGDHLRELFAQMGAHLEYSDDGGLALTGPADGPKGLTADLSAVGELLPTIAAVAALATSPSRLTGLAHVRGHETDRLAALATELHQLGCEVMELPDGLEITPRRLTGTTVECYHDHRMATFGAIIGLKVPGVRLSDVATTDKTLPGFADYWTSLVSGHN